jgi:hypothetical protein
VCGVTARGPLASERLTGAVGIVFRRHEAVIAGALVIAANYPLAAGRGVALVALGAFVAQPCLDQQRRTHSDTVLLIIK